MVKVHSTDELKNFKEQHSASVCPKGGSPGKRNHTGIVHLERQKKGRKGKAVTVISGLSSERFELEETARKLKMKCGVGGAVISNTILIQGDKRAFLKEELESMGYEVKLSGG